MAYFILIKGGLFYASMSINEKISFKNECLKFQFETVRVYLNYKNLKFSSVSNA
ncbi:hypothetical protein D3C85_322410 [compost metagenome]